MNKVSAEQFGKIAVIMGGTSAEREISLKSGEAVYQALITLGVDAHSIDLADGIETLQQGGFNGAIIMVHGRGGEDGTLQGALESLNIPYSGSGVLGSALGMDKLRCKQIWDSLGLPTPNYVSLGLEEDWQQLLQRPGLPLFIKPAHEGSSIGISRAESRAELKDACDLARHYDRQILAERLIDGDEYTVAILNNEPLPAIRLQTTNRFYDYQAKYEMETTRYLLPCGLAAERERELQQLAIKAFKAINADGWGRVDVMADSEGNFWLLEVNTVPGMTDHSLVPMAAKAAGIDFNALVWQILQQVEVEAVDGNP